MMTDQQLPNWSKELITLYESNATNQFILYGNVYDRLVLPLGPKTVLGDLNEFLLRVLMAGFDVILSYDLGHGIRIEKGGEIFSQWPSFKENQQLPKAPRMAIETLTHYFRYCANLARLNISRLQVGCFIKAAHLVMPALYGALNYDLNAMALLVRDWAGDNLLTGHTLATFLITENLNDLHPLLVNNPRTAQIKIPLPSPQDLQKAFELMAPRYTTALGEYGDHFETLAHQLAGTTVSAIESLLKTKEYQKQKLISEDLVELKKQLVEKDCNGLIEFIESQRTLDDLYGQEKIKAWLRQDIVLWNQNDLQAMPKGYLLCGPVGTGKTFLVECLAGEVGVPVVKLKNFRDKWVGSTEGNLEKIFRLLQALGRCFVFIDEADQALGKRDSGTGDSGLSGRVYSMIAEEMGQTRNRGKIIWILASSRPDLIEVDLKRPGRIDVKIPIFPTTSTREGFQLIQTLCRKRGIDIEESQFPELEPLIPLLLTPGAAEALAVKVYRLVRTESRRPAEALKECLSDYQNPVPPEVMNFQIRLAIQEASDLDFVPPYFRSYLQR
ncbi:MAG TPA: ATP-binding protein [Candidatus Limnocylindrales bacterium]|nr:ATP-binding protein [Candidatus Limnocylindrales bacterium]